MAAVIVLKVDAAEQKKLERRMRLLPDRVFTRVVGSATGVAMTPVLKRARSMAPDRTGLIRASLDKKRKSYKRSGTVVCIVGPRRGYKDPETGEDPVNIVHLIEKGVEPHEITGRAMPIMTPGGVIYRARVMHPGLVAKPFIGPALWTQKAKVVSTYRERLIVGVNREVRKLGGSAGSGKI